MASTVPSVSSESESMDVGEQNNTAEEKETSPTVSNTENAPPDAETEGLFVVKVQYAILQAAADDYYCDRCKDNPNRNCRYCSCRICKKKKEAEIEENETIVCDECLEPFHLQCLGLDTLPDGDWYCTECKTDDSKLTSRDGKKKIERKKQFGNKTLDRANKGKAAIRPPEEFKTHFGPIRGIEVGQTYYDRMTAYSSGVHCNHMDGIVGNHEKGAYSIVSSGGYADDVDKGILSNIHHFWISTGDILVYTGSGGADLSGNKRNNVQSFNQSIEGRSGKSNKALALSCHCSFSTEGGDAGEKKWKQGKPVRVIRGYAKRKNHKTIYDPEEGYRYDGIYKVKKYWKEKGKHDTQVWKYELRRDDPAPAPWTEEGKKRIEELGLRMKFPPYGEIVKQMFDDNLLKGKGERTDLSISEDYFDTVNNQLKSNVPVAEYKIPGSLLTLISHDKEMAQTWARCVAVAKEGKVAFAEAVKEAFECVIGACASGKSENEKYTVCHKHGEQWCEKVYCGGCAAAERVHLQIA